MNETQTRQSLSGGDHCQLVRVPFEIEQTQNSDSRVGEI